MSRRELHGVHYRGTGSAAGNDGFAASADRHFQVPPRADATPTVRLLKAGHHVVLSEEAFLGRALRSDIGELYSHAVSRAAAVRDYFHDKTPFQVVIYLRPQHQWLESLYNQGAKNHTLRADSTEFAERAMEAPYFRWTRLINDLKEELGPDRLIVRPYRPGLNVIADFLTILGVPIPQRLLHPKPENPSLPPEQVALRARLRDLLEAAGDPGLLSWAHHLDNERVSQESTADFSMFTEDTQARLIQVAASDWEHLPAVVADTHLAEPHQFESLAQDVQQAEIKPYFGSLDDVSIAKEAVRLLTAALPYVRTHPIILRRRVNNLARRVRRKAQTDPNDLPRASIAFLRRKTSSITRL